MKDQRFGLTRHQGFRNIKIHGDDTARTREIVNRHQRGLTRLASRSMGQVSRRSWFVPPTPTTTQNSNRTNRNRGVESNNLVDEIIAAEEFYKDSGSNLDEATLHTLCNDVAKIVRSSGDAGETQTLTTDSTSSFEDSWTLFASDSGSNLSVEPDSAISAQPSLAQSQSALSMHNSPSGTSKRKSAREVVNILFEDVDLQRAELERLNEEYQASQRSKPANNEDSETQPSNQRQENQTRRRESKRTGSKRRRGRGSIEISPGFSLPFIGSNETWDAIVSGRVVVTTCCSCSDELTCSNECTMVICADCWACSHVDQGLNSNNWGNFCTEELEESVGLGIKAVQVREWLRGIARNECAALILKEHESSELYS